MDDFNSLIIEQINQQLKSGFASSLQEDKFCVVKTGIGNIVSVLPAQSAKESADQVFGPDTFKACNNYVNNYSVSLISRTEIYCVVRKDDEGDPEVVLVNSISDRDDVIFGPNTFVACDQYRRAYQKVDERGEA
ncbi:hypothetical protein [Dyella mobilis]|uniref:Uncharacterized protein n=1 Tax=Dyella mobilis TaxID=1849582 RepID=A0ABS2KKA8_9GAMM|nr:hypothetical protein [Dyella mobilis]MBM7131232.1 hypothetical protein [Dyella mobilis]GLQ98831.1 hypothetical protein GCM10007863_32510 [Dyella mobilis]